MWNGIFLVTIVPKILKKIIFISGILGIQHPWCHYPSYSRKQFVKYQELQSSPKSESIRWLDLYWHLNWPQIWKTNFYIFQNLLRSLNRFRLTKRLVMLERLRLPGARKKRLSRLLKSAIDYDIDLKRIFEVNRNKRQENLRSSLKMEANALDQRIIPQKVKKTCQEIS